MVFRLCCEGVQVELGVSPKQLHFDKLLLHRSVTPQPLGRGRELSASSPPASLAVRLLALEAGLRSLFLPVAASLLPTVPCWLGCPVTATSSVAPQQCILMHL